LITIKAGPRFAHSAGDVLRIFARIFVGHHPKGAVEALVDVTDALVQADEQLLRRNDAVAVEHQPFDVMIRKTAHEGIALPGREEIARVESESARRRLPVIETAGSMPGLSRASPIFDPS
jgi:hypothetical protein